MSEEGSAEGNRRRFARIGLAATLVVALSATGYLLFVKHSHTDTARLSTLVIVHPGITGLQAKPVHSQVIPTASSTYPTVKKLGTTDPDHTGSYGRNWSGPAKSTHSATILLDLLPTTADAAATRTEAAKLDLGAKSFTTEHFVLSGHFAVRGVPGTTGSTYTVEASATSVAGKAYALVYRFDRVVISELVETGPTGLTEIDAGDIARTEYRLLQQVEPGFSLVVITRPTWPSIWYGIVSIVVLALVLVVPWVVRRVGLSRRVRREARFRYQYQSRGRKTVRRQRSPDWSRPRR